MALWTLFGLRAGRATTAWPTRGDAHGQGGVLGMPRFDPEKCRDGCRECADVCLPDAIQFRADGEPALDIDYGRCIACQLCVEACPTGALTASNDWALGVRERDDLHWRPADADANNDDGASPEQKLAAGIRRVFGRSLHIRHVDAGSCNGCESELQALNNPFYNLHRLGIFFTASPRHADLLLVTGTVTYAMRDALQATYEAMPEPRWVLATGTCAVSGGAVGGTYASGVGVDPILPVDVYLPGCPPNPAALIHALLMIVGRAEQHMRGGQLDD
ncbi:NADH-quinone oxidoreductase subunit NuoB [Salinisphaera sp. RV14]|uniref:NADH-quinone oxidoreductase subunit NuoB n=1 Tax=Salinisphaera sp. RV14 TaxID=3454140 RepID=UPI003F86CE16